MSLAAEFTVRSLHSSDINEHMPILAKYGGECSHITELGTRSGNSTTAFLYSKPRKMIAYDINKWPDVDILRALAIADGIDFQFIQSDDLTIEIEPTELLFIDTIHTYKHFKQELDLHGNKASKYIIVHDTITFGTIGEDGSLGINQAITDFIISNPHWNIETVYVHNNGLTILKRI